MACRRNPPDVLLCQRTIKSLEQENAWLKERLAQSLTTLQRRLDRLSTALKEKTNSEIKIGG